jgi:hypothetical protein
MNTQIQDSLQTYTAFHKLPNAVNVFSMLMQESGFSS